jgi:hypothetical protein
LHARSSDIPLYGEIRLAVRTEYVYDMTAADVELVEETEAERVERWRAEELARAGFAPDTAHILARRTDIDLHFAVELVERGCEPELAADILL